MKSKSFSDACHYLPEHCQLKFIILFLLFPWRCLRKGWICYLIPWSSWQGGVTSQVRLSDLKGLLSHLVNAGILWEEVTTLFKLIKMSYIWCVTWNPSCSQLEWEKLELWPSPTQEFHFLLNCMSGWMYPPCLCLSNIPCKVEVMAYCNQKLIYNYEVHRQEIWKWHKKICPHPSYCINRNRLQREKLLELELPRMPCTHLQKPLTISKSGLQNLGSVPSGKLSSWAGQEGALTSCHIKSNDEQISD